jgi:hypothetical protein
MPIYYLYSHALELTLKSFLQCKGFSVKHLASREFGHKLQVLWDACIENDIGGHAVNNAFVAQMVELLDPFAVDFEFRYIKVGLKSLPDPGSGRERRAGPDGGRKASLRGNGSDSGPRPGLRARWCRRPG